MMIRNLDMDRRPNKKIDLAFAERADHFLQQLATQGLSGLIERYERHAKSVETQTCNHGVGGRYLSGVNSRLNPYALPAKTAQVGGPRSRVFSLRRS